MVRIRILALTDLRLAIHVTFRILLAPSYGYARILHIIDSVLRFTAFRHMHLHVPPARTTSPHVHLRHNAVTLAFVVVAVIPPRLRTPKLSFWLYTIQFVLWCLKRLQRLTLSFSVDIDVHICLEEAACSTQQLPCTPRRMRM